MGALFCYLYGSCFFAGVLVGVNGNDSVLRDKMVIYCIEKPQLCKDEYTNIKTQIKLKDYQRPELEKLK